MKPNGSIRCRRAAEAAPIARLLLVVAAVGLLAAAPATAQLGGTGPDGKPNIIFNPGLRLQPRYTYDNADANNDFFIARTRIKAGGEAYQKAKFYAELKLDNVGRFARTVNAEIENAWLDFGLRRDLSLRVGLYDAVFSRNALTSDSKLLLMDRTLIKDALTALGLADNSIGLLAHGRPNGGRFEYAAGMFDNLQFEQASSPTAKQADGTMQMGRLGVHLLDPAPQGGYADYKSSYLGKGRRLSFAANGAYLSKARDGATEYTISAYGGDMFFNAGPAVFEAEYERFEENAEGAGTTDISGEGWYVQTGYMVRFPVELAARYQERDANVGPFADRLRWTTVGFNVYFNDHNLKLQTDYTFKREHDHGVMNDLFQMQLQLDY